MSHTSRGEGTAVGDSASAGDVTTSGDTPDAPRPSGAAAGTGAPAGTGVDDGGVEGAAPADGGTDDGGDEPVPDDRGDDVPPSTDRADVPPGTVEANDHAAGPGDAAAPRRDRWVGIGTAAALALPIVIALVAVRTPRWYPQVDLAQIEMRVRDVFTAHPPTIGLGGRIFGINNTQGAHPGPLSFYLLAPVYNLFGGSSWALQAAGTVLNVAALAASLWATYRRWGRNGMLLMAAGLAFAIQLYGLQLLTYPWNPFMPVLFWVLFLVAVWGVLCGDLPLLPVAVLAGSLCAQTHLPYVGLVGGLILAIVIGQVVAFRRAKGDAPARRRIRRWVGGSALFGLVLWLPTLIQQFGGNPGNISIIIDSFTHPREPAIGYADGWSILVRHLDVVNLLRGGDGGGNAWVGGVLLALWVVSVVVAVRLRARDLWTLDLVVAVALVLGLVNASNILGNPWYYLSLWAYGTAVLALVAVVATAARALGPVVAARAGDRRQRLSWVPTAALVVAIAVPLVPTLVDATDTRVSEQAISDEFAAVFPDTLAAIEDGTVPGGPDGTFLVTWSDPVSLGGPGFSMVLELERAGYDAGALDVYRLSVREHRVVDVDEADAEIHVAFGVGAVDQARTHPGAREITFVDPRTDEQRAEYMALRADVIEGLQDADLEGAIPDVDLNLFALAANPELPRSLSLAIFRMGELPQPMSVLVWEPGS